MANYVPLPAYKFPGNAMLDFSGVNAGLDTYGKVKRENAMFDYTKQQDAKQNARADAAGGRAQQAASREQTTFNQEQAKQFAVQTGKLFESHILPEQDPQKRAAMVNAWMSSHPDLRMHAIKSGIDPNDSEAVIKDVMADYQQYTDPLAERYKNAQIKELEGRADYYSNKANNPGGGQNAPAGYRYSQASPGELEAIPGGPAAKLPAETAARIGMMRASMSDLPEVRDIFLGKVDPKTGKRENPTMSGVGGVMGYTFGAGETGQGKRLIRGGIESLLRAASGAAVPETEVTRYESLFMPTPADTAQTRARKLDSFERWMSRIQQAVESGRPLDLSEARKLEQGTEAGRQEAGGAQPRQAPDGNYYVPDPNRPGKYLRVDQ